MESSILKQIARFLQEQKKQRRWMAVFLCMALIVGLGTVTALKMRGQAMTHKERVVDCPLEVHQHTEECWDENKENLICGYADYVVHVHNDDCYDWNGNLTCKLPEIEKHEHTDECYTEEKTLVCGQEESAGHQHGAECYTREQGGLICQVPEHTHTAACYDETGAVICGMEEHTHTDDCYEWNDVLTCQIAEGEGGHTHTDACYEVKKVLTCGKLELHTHTDECYEKINEDEELSETNRRLVCTIPVLEEHVHTEDAGCFKTVIVNAEGEVVEEETTEAASEEEVFTTDLDEEETAESEEADAADAEKADAEQKTYDETKTYEGDGYVVTVSYNKDANIPEDAELIAEQITEESDAEKYKEHEAKAQEMMDGEETGEGENALFKIGFYVEEDGKKKEIEPETPVSVTIQLLDEDGALEGSQTTIIHFAKEGNEVLDGSDIEDGSTTFEMDSFSYVWVEIEPKAQDAEETDAEKVSVHISKDAAYEDDVFSATFHIEGEIEVSEEIAREIENGSSEDENEGSLPSEEEAEEDSSTEVGTETDSSVEEEIEEVEGEIEEETEEDTTIEGETEEDTTIEGGTEEDSPVEESDAASGNEKLKFKVEPLAADCEEYQEAVENTKNSEEEDQMLRFEILSYSLTYEGEEIDLAGCKVTAEITTAESLVDKINETSVPETIKEVMAAKAPVTEVDNELVENGTGIMLRALNTKRTSVEKVGDVYLNQGATVEPIEFEQNVAGGRAAMYAAPRADVMCTVQYYAYAQTWAKSQPAGGDAINVINTSVVEDVKGSAALPNNWTTPQTKPLYVKAAGQSPSAAWPQYEPAYEAIDNVSSLTQLYASSQINSTVVLGDNGVKDINKFAKEGLNFGLYELWVLKEGCNADSTNKNDWDIYTGKDQVEKLRFTNLEGVTGENIVLIKDDTVLRLVGLRNEETDNPHSAYFFDYDFTNGSSTKPKWNLQGINNPGNYKKDNQGNVVMPRYGFGNNSSGATGLKDDQIYQNSKYYNINMAKANAKTIIEKCSFGLVENSLVDGYPKIIPNAPDLFNPEVTQIGKTNIEGYSLNFLRSGDTYTLSSVDGAGNSASELNKFQKRPEPAYGTKDTIWTNQFWPMDTASTFGDTANKHDVQFGTQTAKDQYGGLATSDDGQLHNSFFGMTFSVGFTLTEDYVGPLNYYFFGDDDMWVFLEYPDGTTKLICDIGGVHQAAGEYVNLWNYIQRPDPNGTDTVVSTGTGEDEKRGQSYKLKFFYTERGASGSTCWMQFTLPSVNQVPTNTTGNAKSTLTLKKTVDGELTDEIKDTPFLFKFILEGEKVPSKYQYSIQDENGNVVNTKTPWIRNGDTFELKHNQSFYVYGLQDGTTYKIKEEVDPSAYRPVLGVDTTGGMIISGETVEGKIEYADSGDGNNIDLINHQLYELPKTGGPGPIIYTMAGVLVLLTGAGFMYRKKLGKGGHRVSSGN